MSIVYLIRHASPQIQPQVPPPEWVLSERGQHEAEVLAATAAQWGLEAVYASSEPKARATALIIGDALELPVHVVPAFDELRIRAEWIANSSEFNELVQTIFSANEPPPRGCELPDDAAARFAQGLSLVAAGPTPAAVVSHGRVLTAYLSRYYEIGDAFAYWRSIPMPGWIALDLDAPGTPISAFTT